MELGNRNRRARRDIAGWALDTGGHPAGATGVERNSSGALLATPELTFTSTSVAAVAQATLNTNPVLVRLVPPRRVLSAECGAGVSEETAPELLSWIWPVLVFIFAAALTFALTYVEGLRSPNGLAVPHFVQTMLPDATLGLHVEFQGEHLVIAWNRRSPVVRDAAAGVLQIEDGGEQRRVHLDQTQIAAGSLLYKPASDDITFRLELFGDEGNKTVESVRVLCPRSSPPENTPPEQPAQASSSTAPSSSTTTGQMSQPNGMRRQARLHQDSEDGSSAGEPANSEPPPQTDSAPVASPSQESPAPPVSHGR